MENSQTLAFPPLLHSQSHPVFHNDCYLSCLTVQCSGVQGSLIGLPGNLKGVLSLSS